MILTTGEKDIIANLEMDEYIEINDESRSEYRFEVGKVNDTEYVATMYYFRAYQRSITTSKLEDVLNFFTGY